MTYEELLDEVAEEGIVLYENNKIGRLDGLYVNGTITLNTTLKTNAERKCTLVEELGHHKRTVGDIRDQSKIENRKQERFARAWGYEKLISPIDIIKAKKTGVRNYYELAEYLGLEQRFLKDALKYFKDKYGNRCATEKYIIQFDPLEIYEKIDLIK